jgi:protein-disulfide isomerase
MRHIWWFSAVLLFAFAGLAQAADQVPTLAPDDSILGKAEAPITIFEYASLTCPHCAEFDQETFPKVKSEWIDPGKARLVFRDYPLDQMALKAAMLARCAPPDKFFSFIDVLFRSQMSWAAAGSAEAVLQALSRIARLGGISEDKFNACINDKALNDRILNERLVAQQQYGVESTPTFFVNGKKVVGALPYDDFAKQLTAASP